MSRYREIAAQLRAAIERGEDTYAPGATIPSEDDLATEYDVSRPVINRALRVLQTEGLVRVERGRGTVVHAVAPLLRDASTRHSKSVRERDGARGAFDAEVRARGYIPRSELHQTGPVTPPAAIAERLGLQGDDVAAIRQRHMYADSTMVQVATSYIPWDIARETVLTQKDTGPGGTYSRLKDLGHEVARLREEVYLRRPTPEEAATLDIAEDLPVHVIYRIAYTAEHRPVEVTEHVMPGTQWVLAYEWDLT